jgi:hypothetical protein
MRRASLRAATSSAEPCAAHQSNHHARVAHPLLVVATSAAVAAAVFAPLPQRHVGPARGDNPQPVAATAVSATGSPGRSAGGLRVVVTGRGVRPGRHGSVTVPVAGSVSAKVVLADGAAHRTVRLQRRGHGWTTVQSRSTRAGGLATLRVPTARPGSIRYRVLVPAAAGRLVTSSTTITLVVRPAAPQDSPVEAVAVPLAAAPSDDTAWSLLDTGRPGVALRWDPCRPVSYSVHLGDAPAAFAEDVADAVQQLAAATGLTFVAVGTTPYPGPTPTGDQTGWPADADLLVTVADETTDPALEGSVVGYASVLRASWTASDARIERAEVVLRDEYVVSAEQATTPGSTVDELLLHELGHAVGLGHSPDSTEVMYPELGHQPRPGYQSGDRNGLARVGAGGGCLT